MKHPILNKNSPHYDQSKKSIYDFEKEISVGSMVDTCNFEIFRYTSRLGLKEIVVDGKVVMSKEQVKQSDIKKIETWKNYRDLLMTVLHSYSKLSVRQALDGEYPDLEYTL